MYVHMFAAGIVAEAWKSTCRKPPKKPAKDPAAAVSGWYFAHPESRYFGIGKLTKDQVEDYASRRGEEVSETERWLAPNLGY